MLQKYITLYEMMQKEITEDKIINMPVERYVSRLGFPTCERCLFLYSLPAENPRPLGPG